MTPTRHGSNNHVFVAPAGWPQSEQPCEELPVTLTEVQGHPAMVSYWKPTDDELQQLAAGGRVALCVLGNRHPVVSLGVEP